MKFLRSENAVSEVVGYSIILGITVIGVGLITLVGVPSIYKLQDMTIIKSAEQSFTLLDSKASGTLLGDAPMRVAKINLEGGTLTNELNGTGRESYMFIKSANNTFNMTIPMGKLKYTYGDRIVGYEGGGVWSKYPSGGSVMVFPPEFHYDGRTLMLPILTVNGNASVGGKGTATVVFKKNSTIVLFPNTTIDKHRVNPLDYTTTGVVYVNITSDFYDAWAEYARSLSFTRVSTDKKNRTANIRFDVVPSTLGGSTVIQNPIRFTGVSSTNNTPLDNFSFKITSAGNNLDWDIRAKSGTKTLIFYLKDDNNWGIGKNVTLKIGYKDTAKSGDGETWKGNGIFTIQPDGFIYVDLLNKSINLKYEKVVVGANNANKCKTTADKINGISNPAYSWDSLNITDSNANNTQSLYNITQHYFSKIAQEGDSSFYKCASGNNNLPGPDSNMIIDYDATGTITFLYLSNNIADVNIN
jgi:hypothetical protein